MSDIDLAGIKQNYKTLEENLDKIGYLQLAKLGAMNTTAQ